MGKETASVKKKIIGLISVIVALSIILGIYFMAGNRGGIPPNSTGATGPVPTSAAYDSVIFNLKQTDIKYITVKNYNENEFKLIQNQVVKNNTLVSVYNIDSRTAEDSSQTEIGVLFSFLSVLKGRKVSGGELAQSKNIDEDYGFDKGTKTTLEMSDGTKYVLETGNFLVPEDAGIYVRKEGDSNIYIINYFFGYNLKSTVNAYKNLTLLNKVTGTDFLTKLSMSNDGKLQYTLEATPSTDTYGTWKLTAPVPGEVSRDSRFMNFTYQFYSITAHECLGEEENLESYGLLVPKYEVVYYFKNEEYKISFGNKTQDGNYFYAKWDDKPDVYLMDIAAFPLIDMGLIDIMKPIVVFKAYSELNKFELTYQNKNYSFDISSAKGTDNTGDAFKYNGKLFTQGMYPDVCGAFRKVYMGALSLMTCEYDFTSKPVLENPEITMKFYDKTTKDVTTLDYVRRDGDRYYIFRNGEYTNALARVGVIYNSTNISDPGGIGIIKALEEFETVFKTVK